MLRKEREEEKQLGFARRRVTPGVVYMSNESRAFVSADVCLDDVKESLFSVRSDRRVDHKTTKANTQKTTSTTLQVKMFR